MERGGMEVRTRYGVIALTPGNTKVALVRLSDTGAWQFPSVQPGREVEPLEGQLDTVLSVAKQQLGLDVTANLCSQPVIHVGRRPRRRQPPPPLSATRCRLQQCCATHSLLPACCLCCLQALGPEPRVSTKFFLAFNVPETELAPAAGKAAAQGAQAASWEDLQVGAHRVSAGPGLKGRPCGVAAP